MQHEMHSINKSINKLEADIHYHQKVKRDLLDKIETTEGELKHLSQLEHAIDREKLQKEIIQQKNILVKTKKRKVSCIDKLKIYSRLSVNISNKKPNLKCRTKNLCVK